MNIDKEQILKEKQPQTTFSEFIQSSAVTG